jgi:small-conductance mechanosensitive channel
VLGVIAASLPLTIAGGWDVLTKQYNVPAVVFYLVALLALVVFWVLARLLSRVSQRALQRARVDAQLSLLLARVVFLGMLLLGVIVAVGLITGSATVVFGSFGIAALAFSLAFQDILRNFLSGMFLLLERPFRIGDEIEVDGLAGTVLNVELRTTTLRTADGQEVLIPNSIVYSKPLTNRTRFDERQYAVTARLPPNVPVDRLRRDLEATLPELGAQRPFIGVSSSVDGGLQLEVRYWLKYAERNPMAVQTTVTQKIHELIDAAVPQPR